MINFLTKIVEVKNFAEFVLKNRKAKNKMLEVYTYNAGKGDCIRLHYADTHNIFIDSGVTRFGAMFQRLCNQIRKSGETLDALILTHMDVDHIGGILACLRQSTYQCPFSEVWMNHSGNALGGDRNLSVQQNDEVYVRLKKQGVRVLNAQKGDCRELAGAKLKVFWPEIITSNTGCRHYQETQLASHSDYPIPLSELAVMSLPIHDASQSNKQSIVFTFVFDDRKLLFTGDAWAEDIVKAKGIYDMVKLSHHGSARNISEVYQSHIHSTNFLICTDGINHPDKQTIAKLEKWYGEINVYSPGKMDILQVMIKNIRLTITRRKGL